MRTSIAYVLISVIGGLLSLLFPIVLHAQPLIKEPFVCAGVYDKGRLFTHPPAKIAKARPSHLTALVIFTQFAHEAPEDFLPPPYAEDLFDPDLPGSLSHFYHHMSFGQFEIAGTVLPKRYTSFHEASYYVPSEPTETQGHFGLFNQEILQQVDGEVDFGQFDNEGPDGIPNSGDDDGYVDFVFINLRSIGEGFFVGTATGVISLGLKEPYVTNDPSASGGFIQIQEGATERVWNFTHAVGVMAHELGHGLGLPDLYDTSPWTEVPPAEDSAGIGNWGLMGRGALGWHGDDGPVPFSAWSREQLGWIGEDNRNLVVVEEDLEGAEIGDIETGGTVYKLPVTAEEYFLVEHRRASGSYYNRHIPGDGLLIWHIYASRRNNKDEQWKRVDLECADGLFADKGYPIGRIPDALVGRDNLDYWSHDTGYRDAHAGNLGDATDPFDGTRFTAFNGGTNPSSRMGDGTQTGWSVTHIRRAGTVMTADFHPGSGVIGVRSIVADDDTLGNSQGDGDGFIEAGEMVELHVELANRGVLPAEGVTAVLSSLDPYGSVVDATVAFGDVASGAHSGVGTFVFRVSPEIPSYRYSLHFQLDIRDRRGGHWVYPVEQIFGRGILLRDYHLIDTEVPFYTFGATMGNGDGVANPGELIGIRVVFQTQSPQMAQPNVRAVLSAEDAFVDANVDRMRDRPVRPYGEADHYVTDGDPFRFRISSATPSGHVICFHLRVVSGEDRIGDDILEVDVLGLDEMPPQVRWVRAQTRASLSSYSPDRQVQVGDPVAIRCRFQYERPKEVEAQIRSVQKGEVVASVELGDDEAHGDPSPGDGIYYGEWTPTMASDFDVSIVSRDEAGNRGESWLRAGFTSRAFRPSAQVLLYDEVWPSGRSHYVQILDSHGVTYDLWNIFYRGWIDEETLTAYSGGLQYGLIVNSRATYHYQLFGMLRSGLDNGAWLFLSMPEAFRQYSRDLVLRDMLSVEQIYSMRTLSEGILRGPRDDPITGDLSPRLRDLNRYPMELADPAVPILTDALGYAHGMRVQREQYKAVFLTFDLNDLENTEDQRTLLTRALDWLRPSVRPYAHDLSVGPIYAPEPREPFSGAMIPAVQVVNNGTEIEGPFTVVCEVEPSGEAIYRDVQRVQRLAPLERVEVSFNAWSPPEPGSVHFRFYTDLPEDEHRVNDAVDRTVTFTMFTDVTEEVGLGGIELHSVFASALWADCDADGDADLLLSDGRLFVNESGGRFERAEDSGIPVSGKGGVWGDYDNDGDPDLYLINAHAWTDQLFKNLGGLRFVDVSARVGLHRGRSGEKAMYMDYDGDGDLDLYVMASVPFQRSLLYRNEGGVFRDVAEEAGLTQWGMFSASGDLDGDGDVDLYLVTEEGGVFYRNNGDGTFSRMKNVLGIVGWILGTLAPTLADLDGDEDLDVLFYNSLFRNDGDWDFERQRLEPLGIAHSGDRFAVGDVDNDGDLDVYAAGVGTHDYVYLNNGDGTFSDITPAAGVDHESRLPYVDMVDYDGDGDLDLFVCTQYPRRRILLYRNNGNANHWLRVKTVGVQSNRDGMGSRVRVVTDGGVQVREMGLLPAHFGLGKRTQADSLEVRWPSGIVDRWISIPADQTITVVEGSARPGGEDRRPRSSEAQYALFQNRPNPFNAETRMTFALAEKGRASLRIYNLRGQLVRTLVDEEREAGVHSVVWDGKDDRGRPIGSGIYVCRLEAGGLVRIKKIVCIR